MSRVVGTDIYVRATLVGVNVTGATTLQIGYVKPNASAPVYVIATVVTAGTDSVVRAKIPHASVDVAGWWRVFPWIVTATGDVVSDPSQDFEVVEVGAKVGAALN
jgi:hypothetical protein